jgi:hypothetical protein
MAVSPLRVIELEYIKACEDSPEFSLLSQETRTKRNALASRPALGLIDMDSSPAERDRTWRSIVERVRRSGNTWTTISIGLALPGIRKAVKRATQYAPGFHDRVELESAALAGFITALSEIDIMIPRICARLCNRAYVTARRCAIEISRYQRLLQSSTYESHAPHVQYGHIDLVLASAVREHAITKRQAAMISGYYLEQDTIEASAAANGISVENAIAEIKAARIQVAKWLGFSDIKYTRIAIKHENNSKI